MEYDVEYQNPLPENIKKLREQKGLSQTELAKRVGVTSGMVSFYESGRSYPRMDKIEKLAQVLGVTPQELLTKPSSKSAMTIDELNLVANYRTLNPEGKDVVFKAVSAMVASGMYKD